jgi:hypothetical protein
MNSLIVGAALLGLGIGLMTTGIKGAKKAFVAGGSFLLGVASTALFYAIIYSI